MDKESELYSLVCTSTLSKKFYATENSERERMDRLIKESDPVFVAKLAIYARSNMHLRSVPLYLIKQLTEVHKGDSLVGKTILRTVQRADEITELLALFSKTPIGSKKLYKLPIQVKQGIKAILESDRFNEYHYGKYNRDTAVTFKDAIFLTHPKPNELLTKIVEGKLEVPYTWEVELSNAGKSGKSKTLVWQELIDSGKKLGYMALIRNLRNILEAEVSQEHIIKVCERISDEAEVKNSKLLPFRFLSAYREIEGNKSMFTVMLLDSLELAAGYSADSLEGFNYDTRIVIASDVSGSMHHQISEKSSVMYVDIGLLMSMALRQKCKSVITGVFGDTWLVENFPKGNILKNTMKLRHPEGRVGYSTNGYLVIDDLIKRKIISDKVFIFTDGQMWDSLYGDEDFSKYWSKYKKICPEAKLYLFDLAGYGKTPISILRNDVFLIAGWSDEIFKVLQAIEDGSSALKEIKKIEI